MITPTGNGGPAGGNTRGLLMGAVIGLAALLAYANSFSVPLILDDWITILHNPTIRELSFATLLTPAENTGVGGRPIAHLSLVLNYAVSGPSLRGYHVVNVAIHIGAALALFGIVRRTLKSGGGRERFGAAADWCALAAAAAWCLHPLQTQSVTYVSQRTESLMGLFYFLTLYAFVRAVEPGAGRGWLAWSVAACFAGVGSKEGMVTAPVMVLLYDYAFVSGSLTAAWRRRWPYYLALASSWVLLAVLMRGLGERGVGFGQGMSAWSYLLIQCGAVVRYAWLAVWPASLTFDYGVDLGAPGAAEWLAAGGLALAAAGTILALRRKPAVGFLGAWFFVTLAPTSSIVPIPLQPISENRAYLAIAAVVIAGVLLACRWTGARLAGGLAALLVALGVMTRARNADYRSEISIWNDTAIKMPTSARAHNNLGQAQLAKGKVAEARTSFETALRIRESYADAHSNLASVLGQQGDNEGALAHIRRATQLDPRNANAFYNLGVALTQKGDLAGAVAAYETNLRLGRTSAAASGNLGILMLRLGRPQETIRYCEIALRLDPGFINARTNLAAALAMSGRGKEAVHHFQEVLRLQPNHLETWGNLGMLLLQIGRLPEAATAFEQTLRLEPNYPVGHFGLGRIALAEGKNEEAIRRFETVLRLKPNAAEALLNLGLALDRSGRLSEALLQVEAAVKADPNLAPAQQVLEDLRRRAAGTPPRN